MANTTTRQQIRNDVYQILNDTDTSQVFTIPKLNALIPEIELEVAEMWKWQFLFDQKQVITPVFSTLEDPLTLISTTMVMGSNENWENAQAAYVMQNICPYTGVSGDQTLTGVTGIDVPHEAGQTVYPLIQLPTNYHKLLNVYFGRTETMYTRKYLYILANDWWQQSPYSWPACTVLNDATLAYLLCVGHAIGDTITIQYQKMPATYTTDADVSSFPNEYIPYIAMMVAGQAKLRYDDNLDGMGDVLYNQAKGKILEMTKLYGEKEQGMSRLIRTNYQSRPGSGYYGTGLGYGNWNA